MSTTPCSNTYAGPKPFSEIEMKTLSQYLHKVAEIRNNRIYISYHSASQMLLFPWSHTNNHAPEHDLWVSTKYFSHSSKLKIRKNQFFIFSEKSGRTCSCCLS